MKWVPARPRSEKLHKRTHLNIYSMGSTIARVTIATIPQQFDNSIKKRQLTNLLVLELVQNL